MADKTKPSTTPERRIICWGMARSLSTVFEKCISFVDGIQIINEPYQCASSGGPEGFMSKMSKNTSTELNQLATEMEKVEEAHGWDDSLCSYQWVKETLEGDFPGKKIVFSKDLITGIVGKYDRLPRGYIHTFIIRNPVKVLSSLRKRMILMMPSGTSAEDYDMSESPLLKMILPGLGFGEQVDLIEHLNSIGVLTSDPIIIDADDLQNHPESIVRQYCEKTGIPFSTDLLEWEAGDGIVKRSWMISKGFLQGNKLMHYFDAAFASTGFQPAKDPPTSLTPDIVKMAATVEPYYQKLYAMRIKP